MIKISYNSDNSSLQYTQYTFIIQFHPISQNSIVMIIMVADSENYKWLSLLRKNVLHSWVGGWIDC